MINTLYWKRKKGDNELNKDNTTIKKECFYLVPSEEKGETSYTINSFVSPNLKEICTCAAVYPCKHMYLVGLWIEDHLHQKNDKNYGYCEKSDNNNDALESNDNNETKKYCCYFNPELFFVKSIKTMVLKKEKHNLQLDRELEEKDTHKKESGKDIEKNDDNNKNSDSNDEEKTILLLIYMLIAKEILKPTKKNY